MEIHIKLGQATTKKTTRGIFKDLEPRLKIWKHLRERASDYACGVREGFTTFSDEATLKRKVEEWELNIQK